MAHWLFKVTVIALVGLLGLVVFTKPSVFLFSNFKSRSSPEIGFARINSPGIVRNGFDGIPLDIAKRANDRGFTLIAYSDPPNIIHDNMTFDDAEWALYLLIARPQMTCPTKKRYGGNHIDYGGWNMCIHPPYQFTKNSCLVYSFGIDNNWTFDDHVVSDSNCTVKAFDPSMSSGTHRRGTNIWFYDLGVGGTDSVQTQKGIGDSWVASKTKWTMRTLHSLVKMLNDTGKVIDYLKIDVEEAEWEAMYSTIVTEQTIPLLSNVKQLGLEFHHVEHHKVKADQLVSIYARYQKVMLGLHAAGFRIWDIKPIYGPGYQYPKPRRYGTILCRLYEVMFLNVNYM